MKLLYENVSLGEHFSITIQTKPYLKKFLLSRYADPSYPDVLVFSSKNQFGMNMVALLQRPLRIHRRNEELRDRLNHYTEFLTIKFPIDFITKDTLGSDVSDEAVISLNKLIDAQFEEQLAIFCALVGLVGGQLKSALLKFCDIYNLEIDVDITYEAIKQKEFRYRQDQSEKSISAQLSPAKWKDFKKIPAHLSPAPKRKAG